MKNKLAIVYGTRPEFLKIYPIILELRKRKIEFITINTGQHSALLDELEVLFNFTPNYNLRTQNLSYTNSELLSHIILRLNNIRLKDYFTHVISQGDTLTVYAASIFSFLENLMFYHVEAGLRTSNIKEPFPEEYNRRAISLSTKTHFAPTLLAKNNLLHENIPEDKIFITGNTIVDMLNFVLDSEKIKIERQNHVVITLHRRENIGVRLEQIGHAIKDLAIEHPHLRFIWLMHPNPNVRSQLTNIFIDSPSNIEFIEPLNYIANIKLMASSSIIISDSGGIQEEAPSLKKKIIILRDETERPEVVDCNSGVLVGSDQNKIKAYFRKLLFSNKDDSFINPFGSGDSAIRIVNIVENDL
jgi:UDP-N-acetylglucosamine 2-epimerase (non-hydrolysing)